MEYPELIVERKSTSKNKITLAVDRLAVKLQDGQTPEQEAWILAFARHLDAKVRSQLTQTLRGKVDILPDRTGRVSLRQNNREYTVSFTSTEFGLTLYPENLL